MYNAPKYVPRGTYDMSCAGTVLAELRKLVGFWRAFGTALRGALESQRQTSCGDSEDRATASMTVRGRQ